VIKISILGNEVVLCANNILIDIYEKKDVGGVVRYGK
jgi:hypothetical protein